MVDGVFLVLVTTEYPQGNLVYRTLIRDDDFGVVVELGTRVICAGVDELGLVALGPGGLKESQKKEGRSC